MLTPMFSASVANIIRLKFLVDLEDTSDNLCKSPHLYSIPQLTLYSPRHQCHGMDTRGTSDVLGPNLSPNRMFRE
jgi:hypothetical protein